jgi:hypothetical protein
MPREKNLWIKTAEEASEQINLISTRVAQHEHHSIRGA